MPSTSLILRPKKYIWLLFFLISAIFFIFNLNYLADLDDNYGPNGNMGAAFFLSLIIGSVVVYAFLRLLPFSSYLRLDSKGFKWQGLFHSDRYSWVDVNNFTANRFGYVIFDVKMHGKHKSLLESHVPNSLKGIKIMFGNKGALPENYGKTSAELASILNVWKRRYSETSKTDSI